MKKVLSLLLIGLMFVGLAGCGSKEEKNVRQKLEESFEIVSNDDEAIMFKKKSLLIVFSDNGDDALSTMLTYRADDGFCGITANDNNNLDDCSGGKETKSKIDKILKDADITYKELNISYDELLDMEGIDK